MKQEQWGIAGTGNLGGAILTQLGKGNRYIRYYHRDAVKAEAIGNEYPGHQSIAKEELDSLDFLILALPADQIVPFMQDLRDSGLALEEVTMINMATVLNTVDLMNRFPQLQWLGMKFMGHSADLRERGNGLFVTERSEILEQKQEKAIRFFEQLGQVMIDRETVVEQVNVLATRVAVKAALDLERAISEGGYRQEYAMRALVSIAPEVMRSYVAGTMGHFARKIVEQLKNSE
ncbi:NAD(P)-binding domain-containing protein [Brevibacillus choshinensis]|uniref:NAD(P)-binding domain-containing protein n=1 Tax=Brevibacillus choshinensis TaxID=54911 RepID=A0ABX7FM26_BRECH|nr:NAD(P)-binding domain-containing protein [Brevibacillus choshinensis]QRG66900.1 NAD(P)-binding domain-containing protein [Brevibacillus choshinensis]